MGNTQSFEDSFRYVTEVEEPKSPGRKPHVQPTNQPSDESSVYRATSHPEALVNGLPNVRLENARDAFKYSLRRFPNKYYLGKRIRETSGDLGEYQWMTFSEVEEVARAFGTYLVNHDLVRLLHFEDEKYPEARAMKIVGIYSKNCIEWFIAEQGCNAYGMTLCPLYDTLGIEALEFILRQTRLETVVVAYDCLDILMAVALDEQGNMKKGIFLKNIILIDPPSDDRAVCAKLIMNSKSQATKVEINILTWEQCTAKENIAPETPHSSKDIHTLCYTSGTTGMPKGVLIPEYTVISVICGALRGPIRRNGIFEISSTDRVLSYLPLAHVFERCVCNLVTLLGSMIGVYSGDMAKLLDDIKILKPTVFLSVPRLFNRINDKISVTLSEKKLPTQILFNQGLNSKMNRRRNESTCTHRLWDTIVFSKIKAMMGGELRGMISGGAPLDPIVMERMTAFFSVPLMQGYGLSESFGPCFLMHEADSGSGPIGGPWPAVEYKLISVPDLKYFVSDSPPKGELCLRGPGIAVGYFMNPEATDEVWDSDGWFHTGDIVSITKKTKSILIIDRKKNIFKLSQGEYVAPEKIEAVYTQCICISQIFVYGHSGRAFIVAIIVPDEEFSHNWAVRNRESTKLDDLCKNSKFRAQVQKDMNEVAVKNGLKGFEKVKAFHLTSIPYSVENNQFTPTSKVRRAQIKKAYESEIESLYKTTML